MKKKASNNDTSPKQPELVAEALHQDLRVIEAKRLLLEAVHSYKQELTTISPPNPSLKKNYADMLEAFSQYRGGKLYFPYLGSGIGNGALVELADGSVKYDFICGIGPHYLGHSHLDLISSSIDAAISNTIMQGHLQQNIDSLKLCELLVKASKMDHCFLTTSGALANENALKIAFQKNYPANRILAFEKCFIGRTLAMSQITDKPGYRDGLPANVLIDYIPFFDSQNPEESTKRSIDCLKKYLHRYPKQHAAMCFELIQGEGGFYHGTSQFFEEIMSILKKHHIAVFVDEVQSFARTPELFAFQYYGLERYIDIASIGKVSQVCATLFNQDYQPRPGLLSQTFTGSTSAIKGSYTLIKGLLEEGYFGSTGKISQMHAFFADLLENVSKRYPHLIRGPYGLGCMIAFTVYDGEENQTTRFIYRLFEAGIICFIAGSNPSRVRFLIPAGAITFQDIETVVEIVEKTLLQELCHDHH